MENFSPWPGAEFPIRPEPYKGQGYNLKAFYNPVAVKSDRFGEKTGEIGFIGWKIALYMMNPGKWHLFCLVFQGETFRR